MHIMNLQTSVINTRRCQLPLSAQMSIFNQVVETIQLMHTSCNLVIFEQKTARYKCVCILLVVELLCCV